MADKASSTLRLNKLTSDSIGHIISTLSSVVRSDDLQLVARSIVLSFIDKKCGDLLKTCFQLRIDSADSLDEFVVQNTLSKYIVQDLLIFTSRNYVRDTLGPSIKKLLALKKQHCPDPRTNSMNDETKNKLVDIVTSVLTDLSQSSESVPVELRRILVFAQKKLDRKWRPQESDPHRNLKQFVFAYIVIPAVAQPHVWGISKEPHSSDTGRASIIVNKILRNAASGTQFESASTLSAFNATTKKLEPKLKEWTELVLKASTANDRDAPLKPAEAQSAEVIDLAFLVVQHCLYIWKDPILDYRNSLVNVPASEARIFFDMLGILEELELIEGKPECPPDLGPLMLDKSIKPPSKATLKRATTATPTTSSAATSSSSGSPAKPYVRQLSEKWNREHQMMQVEAKKRADAVEQRKHLRETQQHEKEARKAAAASSGPGTPASPPKQPSPILTKLRASTDADGARQPLKRAYTTAGDSSKSIHDNGTPPLSPKAPVSPKSCSDDQNQDHAQDKRDDAHLEETLSDKGSHDSHETGSDTHPDEPRETSPLREKDSIADIDSKALSSSSMTATTTSTTTTSHSTEDIKAPHANGTAAVVTEPAVVDASKPQTNPTKEHASDDEEHERKDEVKPLPGPAATSSPSVVRTGKKPRKKASSTNLVMTLESDSSLSRTGSSSDVSGSEATASPASTKKKKPRTSTEPTAAGEPSPTKKKKPKKSHLSASDDEGASSSTDSPLKLRRDILTIDPSDSDSPATFSPEPHSRASVIVLGRTPIVPELTPTPLAEQRERSATLTSSTPPPTSSSPGPGTPSPKEGKAMGILGITDGSRSSQSMAQVVRELGVSNATLQKELNEEKQKREKLEQDLVLMRERFESKTAKIEEFHSKLTSSILYRRTKTSHLRRLTMHNKRTLNPSIDDNLWDYQSATREDRRAVLASTIFARAEERKGHNDKHKRQHSRNRSDKHVRLGSSPEAADSALAKLALLDSDADEDTQSSSVAASSLERSGGLHS